MKKNIALAIFSCAAAGMMGLSSCESMKKLGDNITKAGLNPFEASDEVSATVVHASTPSYDKGGKGFGKGKGRVETKAGYHQSIRVRTSDGKTYAGSHFCTSLDECVRTGDRGVAKIGRKSNVLHSFSTSY